MNAPAILFLRTALAMFVAGMAIGAVGLVDVGWMTHSRIVAHTHLLLVGWLLNTVFGVAWWMFPRIPGTVARAGWVIAGWAALNGGLLLRVGVDLTGERFAEAPLAVRAASAALQFGGAALLAALVWRRVRPPSTRPRSAE